MEEIKQKIKVSTLTANDLMTKDVHNIYLSQTIKEIMSIFIEKKISGSPIVNGSSQLISVISEADLIKFAALGGLDTNLSHFQNKLVERAKIVTVRKQDLFVEIFKQFLINPVRRVIVVDVGDKIQGIISRRNILKAFLDVAKKNDPNDKNNS